MKILKFGGTSVGSVESIRTLAGIVRSTLQEGQRVAVVTSAMGGITNCLLEMAAQAEAGSDFHVLLQKMEQRHLEVIKALIAVKRQNPVIMQLKIFMNELEDLLQGVKAVGELSARTQDSIVGYGELCSTFIVAQLLQQDHPDARFADARLWIKTDSAYGHARVNQELTDQLIRDAFRDNPAAVFCITGFVASNEKGQTTTLGRGGSDYTAALVGAAIEAEEIQIWTDVDGFMTADPRMVSKAFTLPEISYTEAMELTYFGAKVIYPPTMIPAFEKRIPIVIRNTFNPSFTGTVIREHAHRNGHLIRGISSISDVSLINLQGSGMVGRTGFSGRLFSLLAREGINIILITQASSEHSITLAVSPKDAANARRLIAAEFELELQTGKLEIPRVEDELSVLAVVGENMKHTSGVSGKLFNALGRNGVNVTAIAQGSSEYNISVVIRKNDLAKALNLVHEAFFLSRIKTLNVFYLGVGNIGKTLLRQVKDHEAYLLEHNALRINMVAITNTRQMLFREAGIPLQQWERLMQEGGEPADLEQFISRMKAMNLPNSVFIDNSASADVVNHYASLFAASISVVTCNKIGNSGSYEQYKAFKAAVKKHGVNFLYETNVGAGLPIIKTLQDLLVSGDKIMRIEAILSGTISFIFNEFKGDRRFYDVVKEARAKGYTEPDPRDDLSGLDFMRKMLILARDSGYGVEMEDVEIEPILPESCMQATSVDAFFETLLQEDAYFEELKQRAEREGKVLRYIGVLEDGKVSIRLQAIDDRHPFYALSGSDNIIAFTTNRYTACPLVVKGPGAGAEVTAAGVFADLVKCAN
ncbi:bifunctional aspartate kinase/homoserine dehydrogenase I [Compostibacter hankyongensis]|uniref:Bifunctional aspartate kinase/homoserine dehydrogenase I n=1 Tax=Compostibacter hankyongensis TaxID=1007089 RepID=A0ABP8FJL4_9BACT